MLTFVNYNLTYVFKIATLYFLKELMLTAASCFSKVVMYISKTATIYFLKVLTYVNYNLIFFESADIR